MPLLFLAILVSLFKMAVSIAGLALGIALRVARVVLRYVFKALKWSFKYVVLAVKFLHRHYCHWYDRHFEYRKHWEEIVIDE